MTSTGGASFAYDAARRRVARTAGGVTTAYQYDGDAVLLEKQGSTTTAAYTYGNALLREGGATPLFDGLGSARTLTGSGGSATAGLTTTAFGQTVAGDTGAYGFGATSGYRGDGDGSSATTDAQGNYGDDGDGLIKVGCRYYDPATGSFLTRDTDLSQSPYAYCDGDPVNRVDPSGHWPGVVNILEDVAIGVGIAAVAAIIVPVTATVGVVVATGVIVGAVTGAATSANDYYWDHQGEKSDSWDPGEFDDGVARGGIVGGISGGIIARVPGVALFIRRFGCPLRNCE